MSTHIDAGHEPDVTEEPFDVDDPRLTRFDLVREGARRDGVEIMHYAPRFPVPGTRAEKRIERSIALMFMSAGAAATVFVAAFIWWPWEYEHGDNADKLFNPVLGASLGLSLLLLGFGIISWSKKLLPEEVAVQDRHDGASPRDEQLLTAATLQNMADEVGVKRRPLLTGALLLSVAPLGAVAGAAVVGGMIKNPHKDELMFHTGWDPEQNDGKPVRLVREDSSPIRPEDVSVGGQLTVYPGIPEGTTNEHADSPTLLIHLREEDARRTEANAKPVNKGSQWGNFVAHSKICSHAGCPASLFEQQTNRLLCPCHQSQFNITDNARPIFGPASRSLAQLPLDVDDEGYFVAKSDYKVAIGPAFWERP